MDQPYSVSCDSIATQTTSVAGFSEFEYSQLADDLDLRELLELFLDELPNRLHELTAAIRSTDCETVRRLAHQLKGALGSYGFPAAAQVASQLEDAARDQSHPDLPALLDFLHQRCHRLRICPTC